jgi:hypothetical protein
MEIDMNPITSNAIDDRLRASLRAVSTFLVAIVTFGMLNASPARAETDTIYPGVQCVVLENALDPTQFQPSLSFFGSIGNPSTTQDLVISCPASHDVSSTGIGYGVVAVVSQSASKRVECELYSVNISSAGFGVFSIDYEIEFAGAVSPNTQYLFFPALPANDHYVYECTLPPGKGGYANASYINAYELHQN